MSRKTAAPGGEDDDVADGHGARIAVDDGAAQMHLQAVTLGKRVADTLDRQVEPALQHPDLLVECRCTRRVVEADLGAARQLDLDDLEARSRAARRDVAAQIAARRIAPDRLGSMPRQWPGSCLLFQQRRE